MSFLAYSTQFVFLIIRQLSRNLVIITIDNCRRKKGIVEKWKHTITWKHHYHRLINVEFPLGETRMSLVEPTRGPPPCITTDMVNLSIQNMKLGKSPGSSGMVAEITKSSYLKASQLITDLIIAIVKKGKIPK